jgi:hypothetical protein
MKNKFLSLLAVGLMLGGASQIKAMARDKVNYYSFKFETQNLKDNTSLALYAIDESKGEYAIVRASLKDLATLPVCFNDVSKPKAALVIASFITANPKNAATHFKSVANAANLCIGLGTNIQKGIISNLHLNGALPL